MFKNKTICGILRPAEYVYLKTLIKIE